MKVQEKHSSGRSVSTYVTERFKIPKSYSLYYFTKTCEIFSYVVKNQIKVKLVRGEFLIHT